MTVNKPRQRVKSQESKRLGGRPSREDAEKIRDQILDIATQLFFTQGYGVTSIEAIAAAAGMSKRTFYHRFENKADIFKEVVHRVVTRLRPPHTDGLFEGKNCVEILRALAKAILQASLMPDALALHRLVLAEAHRFPELALMANAEGSRQEAVNRIGALLTHQAKGENVKIEKPEFAANQFLQMIVSLPQRRALGYGVPMTQSELDAWVLDTVDLFLNGCRK